MRFSLELTAGQYGLAILSRHIGKKLTLYEDGKEAVEFEVVKVIKLTGEKLMGKTKEGKVFECETNAKVSGYDVTDYHESNVRLTLIDCLKVLCVIFLKHHHFLYLQML